MKKNAKPLKNLKSFQSKGYSKEVLEIYNKIKQKLESKNYVIAAFKKLNSTPKTDAL